MKYSYLIMLLRYYGNNLIIKQIDHIIVTDGDFINHFEMFNTIFVIVQFNSHRYAGS